MIRPSIAVAVTGRSYVTQGDVLVGPEVLQAVAKSFEAREGQPRHLADRLIEATAVRR